MRNEWEKKMLDIAADRGVLAACREAAARVYEEEADPVREALESAANHLENAQSIVDPSRYLKAAERQARAVLESIAPKEQAE